MRRLCVYCGSRCGDSPEFVAVARSLGSALVARGLGLVYGGGNVGLMGTIADAVLAAGGEVIGVIPHALMERELAHGGTDLRVVGSMHERKTLMFELSDAFVALPGGIGTMEELLEMLTWSQLGIHDKPCAILDVGGYWGPLLECLDGAVTHGFLTQDVRDTVLTATDPDGLLDALFG